MQQLLLKPAPSSHAAEVTDEAAQEQLHLLTLQHLPNLQLHLLQLHLHFVSTYKLRADVR